MNTPVIIVNKRKLELDKKLKQIELDIMKLNKLEEILQELQIRVASEAIPIVKEFCDLRFENLNRLTYHLSDSSIKKKDKRRVTYFLNELAIGLQNMGDTRSKFFFDQIISENDPDLINNSQNDEFESNHFEHSEASEKIAAGKIEIKSLFRELAKVFHPDKEPMEHLKEEKTSLMKKITEAYENQDLHELLKLEKEHLGPREFTEDKVELYMKHINDRLKELKDFEASLKKHGPLSSIYQFIYSQKFVIQEQNIFNEIKKLKIDVDEEKELQQIIWDSSSLRSYLNAKDGSQV